MEVTSLQDVLKDGLSIPTHTWRMTKHVQFLAQNHLWKRIGKDLHNKILFGLPKLAIKNSIIGQNVAE